MKITEVICDRCGVRKEMTTKNDIIVSFARIDLYGVGQSRTTPQRIDSCEKCYGKFINYLESEVQEDD